jgi:hypothetical protein
MNRGFAVAIGILAGALAAVAGSRLRDAASSGARAAPPPAEVQGLGHREAHERLVARHARQPTDVPWSARMTQRLALELDMASDDGRYTVRNIDCRTTMCTATFEWASFTEAMANYGALVKSLRDVPCTREFLLPEQPASAAGFEATMILECDARTTSND